LAIRETNLRMWEAGTEHEGELDIEASRGECDRPMRTRLSTIVLTLVLVALMLALTPLAYADPPDPTWISGIWDDDDADDVVNYITSATGLLPDLVACDSRPVPHSAVLKLSAFQAAVSAPRSAFSPRAPPTI
jgi:hypothetical protein